MASSGGGADGRERDRDRSRFQLRAGPGTGGRMVLPHDWKGPVSWIATIIVLSVVFSFLNPRFSSIENLRNILEQASVPLIIVVGATLVILTGSIDLSPQGVMGATGMTWVLLSANTREALDWGIGAWIMALGLGLLLGLLTGLIYAKLKVPSFVVTLGSWYVGLGIGTLLYSDGQLPSLTSRALAHWPTHLTLGLPNAFWLAAVVVAGGALLVEFTQLGRGILAVGNNENIARSSGMAVNRIKISAFAIAGCLSGLASILATMQIGSGSPDIGSGQLFTVIPAAVIGGTALSGGEGGMLRSALGVFVLIILNNGLVLAGVDPNYQSGVFGALLIIAIVAVAWPQRDRLKVAK